MLLLSTEIPADISFPWICILYQAVYTTLMHFTFQKKQDIGIIKNLKLECFFPPLGVTVRQGHWVWKAE